MERRALQLASCAHYREVSILSYLLIGIGLAFIVFPRFFQNVFLQLNKNTLGESFFRGRKGRISVRVVGVGLLAVGLLFGEALQPRF